LTEGRHWPEDYIKTAFNKLKARFPFVSDEDISKVVESIKDALESIPAEGHTLNFIRHRTKWQSIINFIAEKAGAGSDSF